MNPYQPNTTGNRPPQNYYNRSSQQQYHHPSNIHPQNVNIPSHVNIVNKNISSVNQYPGQGQPSPSFSNSSQKNFQTGHQQFFDQYASSNNSPNFRIEQQQNINFPPPQGHQNQPPKNKLIQPPQLIHQDVRQSNSNSQSQAEHYKKISNFENQQDQNDMRDVVWNKQENVHSAFWEKKFNLIFEKFGWFAQRFELIRAQYLSIKEQLNSVDSEDDWNQLKQHHDEFAEKLEEMFQELIAVVGQNHQLIQQKDEGGDSVWEQRYHQLLSNFKALQDQNIQIQQDLEQHKSQGSGNNQGYLQERYDELAQHYNRMQTEYERLSQQYQKIREQYEKVMQNGGGDGPSRQDFQNAQRQFQMQMQNLHGQNQQLQNACQQMFQQRQSLKNQLAGSSQMQNQYEQLIQAIQQKQNQSNHIKNQFTKFKAMSENIHKDAQQELEVREKEKQQLKKALNQKNKQIKQYQNKLQIVQNESELRLSGDIAKLRSQNQILKKLKVQNQQSLALLKQQVERLYSKTNEKDLSQMKFKGIQQKITYLTEENNNLNEKLKEKNNEVIQMRAISYELQKYRNITNDYSELQRQKIKLQEAMRKDKSEINFLKKNVDELNIVITQLNARKFQNKSRGYLTEIQTLNDTIQKKQSQANKFKQLVTVKDHYIEDLQLQLTKSKAKLNNMETLFENERDQFKKKITQLQRKSETAQKKHRGLQLQFSEQLKYSLEQQIQQLRKQNQQKLQKNRHLEDQNDQLKNKLLGVEKSSISFNKNNQHTSIRIKELQSSKQDLLSRLEHIQRELKSKDEDLRLSRDRELHANAILKTANEQLSHSKTLWQSKNNVIKQLQKQVNDFMKKITDIQRQTELSKESFKNQMNRAEEQISSLRNKLNQVKQNGYLSRISHQSAFSKSSPVKKNRQELSALQGKIVDQVTEENARLKNQILQLKNQITQLHSQKPQSRLKSQKSQKSIKQIGSNIIEQRLLAFNDRLENFIIDNQKLAGQGIESFTNQHKTNLFEKQKRQLQNMYEKQIRLLKEQNNRLKLDGEKRGKHSRIRSDGQLQGEGNQIISEETEKSLTDQVEFYKQKLTEQTKTNEKVIKTNEQLKNQLQEYLNSKKNQYSTTEYYKMQWRESQHQIQALNAKVKKLQQQNRRYKHENLQHDTKIAKQYQQKIFDLEFKLQQLNRKISILQLSKAKGDDQRANLIHDIGIYDSQNRSLQKTMNLRIAQSQKQANDLKQKCDLYQNQIFELIQKLKKYQGQSINFSFNQNLTHNHQAIKI